MVQIVETWLVHLPVLYVFCDIGEHVTQRFEGLGDQVYQLDWHTLPLDMQRDLAIVIALAQKRIYVRGYADTRSTRKVFKKVPYYLRSAFVSTNNTNRMTSFISISNFRS